MLAKLLKYDLKSVARVWWILAITALSVSGVGSVVLRLILTYGEYDTLGLVTVMGVLFLFGCFFLIIASALVTDILVDWRFYKHLYTDEGYLTFTLPVRRRTIFLAKSLNALFWTMMELLLIVACIVPFIIISPPTESGLLAWDFYKVMIQDLGMMLKQIGFWIVPYLAVGFAMLLASEIMAISLVHMCITVGAVIAKKAKLLAAIGIYYGINMIFSFVGQFAIYLLSLVMAGGIYGLMDSAAPWMMHVGMLLFMVLAFLMIATIAALLYCFTQNLLERKLNLA